MAKQRITPGSILEININDEYYTYAQILGKASYVFFDYKTEKQLTHYEILLEKPILFITSVYNDVISEGRWLKVGKIDIRKDLEIIPMQFIQDALNPESFEFYDPNTGEIFPATKNQVKGLERAAVWEATHIEDRIKAHYDGIPCVWLQDDLDLFKD